MSSLTMTSYRTCPRCGARVPSTTLAGNCPGCLLELAITPEAAQAVLVERCSAPTEHLATGVLRYFGDYELQRELARGGMGIVYQARQISLNRPVALKMILAGNLATAAQVQRFHLEAEAAAKLDHPGIVPIYEIGEHEGRHYYTMRLLDGGNLAQSNAQCDLRNIGWFRHCAGLLATVARAVHHAHQHGVLHRDLKPSNILLDAQGAPHVTDFGLAKLLAVSSGLTASVELVGTPSYMAPEQARGSVHLLTTAADIYSLGAILYELLSGQPPFQAATSLETMRRVLEEEPTPPIQRTLGSPSASARLEGKRQNQTSRLSQDLETICLRCLNKNPRERYESAEALALDLERALAGEPIRARPVGARERLWRWGRRNPKLAILSLVVLLLLLMVSGGSITAAIRIAHAGAAARRAEAKATDELRSALLAQARAKRQSGRIGQRLESLAVIAKAAAIAPSLELRNEAVAALGLSDLRFTRLWPIEQNDRICFSPDQQLCAWDNGEGQIQIRQVSDKHDLAVLPSVGSGVNWLHGFSPDNRRLAVQYRNGLVYVWDVATRRPLLAALPGTAGAFAPDNQNFWLSHTNGDLVVFALDSKEQPRLIPWQWHPGRLVFQPQGRFLAGCGDDSATVRIYETNALRPALSLEHPVNVGAVAWSGDGQELATGCANGEIYLWDATTGSRKAVFNAHEDQVVTLGFSHNRQLLATASWDGTLRLWDLFSLQPLLTTYGSGYQTLFSPDDSHLSYTCRGSELDLIEVTHSAQLRWLPAGGGRERGTHALEFSRDGRLAAAAYSDALCLWDFTSGRLCSVIEGVHFHSVIFSPDAQLMIACGADGLACWPILRSKEREVQLGQRRNLREGLYLVQGSLSADGRWLAAADQNDGNAALFDLNTPANTLAVGTHPGINYIALSPDGHWLATGTWNQWGVKVWERATRKLVCDLQIPGPASVDFSPNNRWLAIGARDYQVLEVGSWREVYRVSKPDIERVGLMSFSPDSRYLAVAVQGRDIQLLAAGSGRLLASFQAPGQPLISWLRFTPDGTQLAALLWDRRILIWDLRQVRAALATMNLDWDL